MSISPKRTPAQPAEEEEIAKTPRSSAETDLTPDPDCEDDTDAILEELGITREQWDSKDNYFYVHDDDEKEEEKEEEEEEDEELRDRVYYRGKYYGRDDELPAGHDWVCDVPGLPYKDGIAARYCIICGACLDHWAAQCPNKGQCKDWWT